MRNISQLSVLFSALMLAACTTTSPEMQPSNVDVPPAWTRLDLNAPISADADAAIEHDWWKHFGDPTLDALIAEAIQGNKSLQIAKARIEEARANRNIARASLLPQVNGALSATRANQGLLTNDRTFNIADAELDASWEIDLFGRNQPQNREAAAILESEEAASQAVRIGLLAEVARKYFDMRN